MNSMALETSVRECGAGLSSGKPTERKKNAETLKGFLMRNSVPAMLSKNTQEKKGYGWNALFDNIHDYVIKETEKFDTSKTYENITAPLCTSLLHACVSGSNKAKTYIKCDKIIDTCLFILKDKRLTKAIGDAYLSLLIKHVFTCDHYMGYISPSAWEEMLLIAQSVCLSSNSKLDDFTKMKILWHIVKNATTYCQFGVPLRDSLTKMKSCFYGIEGTKKLQDVAIEIMILLLETLSSECRLTMCEFTEALTTPILKFYDQNLDQKKKTSFFKLVHLILMLHHPQGRTQKQEGSLARDWTVWNKHLHSILEILCLEVAVLQKPRKLNEVFKYQEEFFSLSASVYYQVFSLSVDSTTEEAGTSSKRPRQSMNRNKTFTDLIEELRQNHMPWLSIVNKYINKYGGSISTSEYVELAKAIEDLLTNTKTVHWGALEEVTCAIITILTSSKDNEDSDVLMSLWNSSLRICTMPDATRASHAIMQHLLVANILKAQNVQPLIKLYYDKAMLVSDHSVNTLNLVIHKFFNQCNGNENKIQFFNWLSHGNVNSVNADNIRQVLLRLLANDNFAMKINDTNSKIDNLEDTLFDSFEKSILFSEFEIEYDKSDDRQSNKDHVNEKIELNVDMIRQTATYFQNTLLEIIDKLEKKTIDLLEFMKYTNFVIIFLDLISKYNPDSPDRIGHENIPRLLKVALRAMYLTMANTLKSDKNVLDKVKMVKYVQSLLSTEYESSLASDLRSCVNEAMFHTINNVLNNEKKTDDGDCDAFYTEDDAEMDPKALKHSCICFMAAYCRKRTSYRDEILDLILDPKIYNFSMTWDTNCAIQCIELLNDDDVENPPLDAIFTLIQRMCKDLFRNANASYTILQILVKMLDQIWSRDDKMKQNCFIMVKSYMVRTCDQHYSPKVAALVYKCAARLVDLSQHKNHEIVAFFTDKLTDKIKDKTHSIRIYCCYLLQSLIIRLSDAEMQQYLSDLLEIYTITVSERKECVIKDESANRTLTILHSAYALARAKNSLLHSIVAEIIQMRKVKSLDSKLIKKVLDKITNFIIKKGIESYLNDNILQILNFWYLKGYRIDQLPFELMGFEAIDKMIETHIKWMVSADLLWGKYGNITESEVLQFVQNFTGKSVESIIEMCFTNILVLCLPYIVTEKYSLSYMAPGKLEWATNAGKVFVSTKTMLGADKWITALSGNAGEFLIQLTTCLRDHTAAKNFFDVEVPLQSRSYYYPKIVFEAIIKFIGELIKNDYINYLCENRAFGVLRPLFKLWQDVLHESIFEYKVLCLHTYITTLEMIPLGYTSDAFVCSFACNSLAHAIKNSQNKNEVLAYTKALKAVLDRLLPENVEYLKTPITQLLSILMIKKEEGYVAECGDLLTYLVMDMKDFLNHGEDVIDFIASLSQGKVDNIKCTTMYEFVDKLKTFNQNMTCPSHESLMKLREFLSLNKECVNSLCDEINSKGFSDDCGESIIHQVIYALCETIKSATDDKTTLEACNCLAEVGNYDLKTLVTVPPENTSRATNVQPAQYFAMVAKTALADVMFDENPAITNGVAKALMRLFQYRDGKIALDLEENTDQRILLPFASSNPTNCAEFAINGPKLKALLQSQLWAPDGEMKHAQWLMRITVALLDTLITANNYLNALRAVCVAKPDLCRKILPPLVGVLLASSREQHVKLLADRFTMFFDHIWQIYDDKSQDSEDSNAPRMSSKCLEHDLKMIVQYMLEIVNFVRLQRHRYNPRAERVQESLNYLRLAYDRVAWAASVADQSLAAIYYGELWAMASNDGVPFSSPEPLSHVSGGESMQRIFRRCYVSIGEMDAVDGCGTAHLTSEDEKRKHLINTGQHTDALLLNDIALSTHIDQNLQHGVVKSLHRLGMHHIALQYIKSLPENEEMDDIKYDCLSYLGDWSHFVNTQDLNEKSKQTHCNPNSIIKAFRYSCLKDCINLQATTDFEQKLTIPLNRAKLAVARLSQNLNMENCQSVYNILSRVHQFKDIEDYFSVRCNKLQLTRLLNSWKVENLPPYSDFKHLEALLSQRSLILEHAGKNYSDSLKNIVNLQLQYAELSVSSDRVQVAQRMLAMVKQMHSSPEAALVDSRISWAKGHRDIALSLLRDIVTHPATGDVTLTAMSLRQFGIWMAESKRDNAREIIDKYLKKSLQVLEEHDDETTRLKVYYDIAKFADAEYKQIVNYMNSSMFEAKVQVLEGLKGTASVLKATQQHNSLSKDEHRAMVTNQRFGQIDEAEIAGTRAEKESFLRLAMRYYLLSLKEDETNNLAIFRVISLWLDNPSIEFDSGDTFDSLLHAIPSRKFVTVLPQLTPRLSNDKTQFAENLTLILIRCAREHPHHTFPHLFSLQNSDKDNVILNASENTPGECTGQKKRMSSSMEPRVAAAADLIAKLSKECELAEIVAQMDKLCDAIISLANYSVKKKSSTGKQNIPAAEYIHRMGPLDAIPIPTATIPISSTGYQYITSLHSFESFFELVGGINCPKKISCKGSDGVSRVMLIKGEDDLRQDAVMQQVFNIVNTLLRENAVTKRSKLLIRTYKVVPMSRRAGALEWCEGTIPLGSYLYVGNTGGAHARYRPQDISVGRAREMLSNCQGKTNQEKLAVFTRILREFKPVFHYFFTENFLDPVTWYERRLAYTKSVATSSMIGHVLGLGDRHLQNILIDKRTAEVVHIDFGIAFDRGQALPTPETIPFRLTQDIVAGFGSVGVEGIFRKCCERTMQLLRDNQDTLLTILEVLLCDPLYSWVVVSKQQNVLTAQCRDTSANQACSEGSLAKRALLTVSSKLSGTEGGVAGGVSVAGQVARLIHEAMDVSNLSRLYHGWQAYL